jgi:hypothetical protein
MRRVGLTLIFTTVSNVSAKRDNNPESQCRLTGCLRLISSESCKDSKRHNSHK